MKKAKDGDKVAHTHTHTQIHKDGKVKEELVEHLGR